MSVVFASAIRVILVPLMGYVLCTPAGAQDVSDQSVEFLETLEIADTLADEEERVISIPKPDTKTEMSTVMRAKDLLVFTITKNPLVSLAKRDVPRDSIADRKGLWQTIPLMTARAERRFSLAALDTTAATPFNGQQVTMISKNSVVPWDRPEPPLPRDSIADRKALRKTVRLIKSERPPYPQVARRQGWEGTVVLRINIGAGGDVTNVSTQKSTGHDALDESATQSVKTWRFDPAKDGEFPVASVVDLPIRFNLDEYGIRASRPEPEPEPILEKTPARLIKSERPDYPQEARKQGWEGTVVLRITVGTGGDVGNVNIQESSGFAELDESAAQSVKTWEFDPAKLGDDPISSVVDLPIRFNLDEYGIQAPREEPEPEPEPEPVLEKIPARLVKSERPDYPQEARKQGWEGTVVLRITVDTGGDVENVNIQESSGFAELDESAAQSVKTWEFDPAKLGDDPISSVVDMPIKFDLEEYKKQEE